MDCMFENQENAMEEDFAGVLRMDTIMTMCSSSDTRYMDFEPRFLRQRPDVVSVYQTPGMFKFRRRMSMEPRIDYLSKYPIPDCVFYSIFSFLNKRDLCSVMRTCRRFCALAQCGEQWKSADMGGKTVADEGLIAVLNRGVRTLRLADSKMDIRYQVDPATLPMRLIQQSKLTYLDLSRASFDPTMIQAIVSTCRFLKCLSLEGQQLDTSIGVAIGRNQGLTHLDLSMTTGFRPEAAYAICSGCKQLEELNISWCGLQEISVSILCQLLPITLTKLNMSGTLGKKSIQLRHVIDLMHCKNLIDLDLSDNEELNEEALTVIVNRLRLQTLSLNRCFGISPIHFLVCANIPRLNVHGCTTEQGQMTLCDELNRTEVNKTLFNYTAKASSQANSTRIWGQRVSDLYR